VFRESGGVPGNRTQSPEGGGFTDRGASLRSPRGVPSGTRTRVRNPWSPCEESNLEHRVRSPVPRSMGQGEKCRPPDQATDGGEVAFPAGLEPASSGREPESLAASRWEHVERAGRESDPGPRFCRPRSSPEIRLKVRSPLGQKGAARCGEGESNPCRERGMLAHYHYATTAGSMNKGRRGRAVFKAGNPRAPAHRVERRGLAPRSLPCKGRVLLIERPSRYRTGSPAREPGPAVRGRP
jgi:hypothetical protein